MIKIFFLTKKSLTKLKFGVSILRTLVSLLHDCLQAWRLNATTRTERSLQVYNLHITVSCSQFGYNSKEEILKFQLLRSHKNSKTLCAHISLEHEIIERKIKSNLTYHINIIYMAINNKVMLYNQNCLSKLLYEFVNM